MSYTPGEGVDCSIGLGVNCSEPVDLSVSRADGHAWLVLGRNVAEIRLEPGHLETLRDQLPDVLAELDMLDVAKQRVAEAGGRARMLEKELRERADTVDAAGESGRAGDLRGAADKLKAAVGALRSALAAVNTAAMAADDASDDAKKLLGDQVVREQPDEEPAPAAELLTVAQGSVR